MECSHVTIIYLPKAFSCQVFNYRKSMRHLKARITDKWNSLVSPICPRLYLCASGLFVVPRLCDARLQTQLPEIFRFFRKHLHNRNWNSAMDFRKKNRQWTVVSCPVRRICGT